MKKKKRRRRKKEGFAVGNFMLSFGRLRQRILPKCEPHVQHEFYFFFSCNQLNHCFPASLLNLSSLLTLVHMCDANANESVVHTSNAEVSTMGYVRAFEHPNMADELNWKCL